MSSSTVHVRVLVAVAMAALLFLLYSSPGAAQLPPSPGYFPSAMIKPMVFSEGYSNQWGPQHQTLSQDEMALTLLLDRSSGIYIYIYITWIIYTVIIHY
jgi:xyloglucan:xyloglucosyl transferase